MRLTPLFTALVALTVSAPAFADRYEFDKAHTNIVFFINHLGYSDMIGKITAFDGTLTFDEKAPDKSTLDVTLDPKSVKTSSAELDQHLQGDKFFNSATYPSMHFVSKSIKVTGADTGDVTGDFTLLGVTKPITLHVKLNKADYHPMTQAFMAGFSAEGSIKRSDFGMTSYIPMVGDEVKIMIQTETVNQDRKKLEAIQKH